MNLRDAHLPGWTVRLLDAEDVEDFRDALGMSDEPYYVSASHVGRKDGFRRYHHMAVVVVDQEADTSGPMVFDTTGHRGVAFRRVPWRRLARYFGVVLAEGSRVRFQHGTGRVALLHPPTGG